jgi:hypothetical protein
MLTRDGYDELLISCAVHVNLPSSKHEPISLHRNEVIYGCKKSLVSKNPRNERKPRDDGNGFLWLARTIVKQCGDGAGVQHAICTAFQEQNWRRMTDDPLAPKVGLNHCKYHIYRLFAVQEPVDAPAW